MTDKKNVKSPSKKTKDKQQVAPTENLFSKSKNFWQDMNKQPSADKAEGMTKGEITRFCLGAVLFFVSCFILLSIASHPFTAIADSSWQEGERAHNWMGTMGLAISRFFIDECWGVASIFIPLFLLVASLRVMQVYKVRLWKWFLNCSLLMIWSSTFMHFLFQPTLNEYNSPLSLGGNIGKIQVEFLETKTGSIGTFLILITFTLAYLIHLSDETIRIIRKILTPKDYLRIKRKSTEDVITDGETGVEETDNIDQSYVGLPPEETATTIDFNDFPDIQPNPGNTEDSGIIDEGFVDTSLNGEIAQNSHQTFENKESEARMTIHQGQAEEEAILDETGQLENYDPKLDLENYKYPTIDLLKHYDVDTSIDMEEQQQNKNKIIQVLSDFGVKISSIKATVGPTITLYEITPAPGVRISKIRNLEDDIALSLSALSIRIIAPIPGKGTIGIEMPNARPQIVSMESIINSRKFQETQFELPMALGKTITNEIFMVDLAKMPHLLVAGATGQGKSVGLNAIITSLLYKKHPAELKLVMVDPKKVEFSVYSPIVNHFLAQVEGTENEEPIITDVQKVVQTLKSLCVEMDSRYDLLKKAGVRNLREYNEKFTSRRLNPNNGHRFMPYIVVIIDEFGDLIMTAGKEVEQPICRIAQLARAVGIHMIIATQRPTTNIITGTIKANFPARMAFKVTSMIDSRTILDRPGAQQLVGKGDMLILAGGTEPVRLQCAFVDTPEVDAMAKYIACQQSYLGPTPLPPVAMEGEDGDGPDVDLHNLDPMFEEVARLVVQTQQGSTSMIQRKFSIGYNRAGRLMDQLEVAGIVGPAHGSKPREVLCISEEDLQFRMDNMR